LRESRPETANPETGETGLNSVHDARALLDQALARRRDEAIAGGGQQSQHQRKLLRLTDVIDLFGQVQSAQRHPEQEPQPSHDAVAGWTDAVRELSQLLHQGDSIYQMMQVTGEEGITLADYVTYQKSLFLDMVYLQQDAYDKVDVSVPLDRQKETFALVRGLIQRDYPFSDKEEAHRFFTQLTGLVKNLNYTARNTPEYSGCLAQIDELVKTLGRASAGSRAQWCAVAQASMPTRQGGTAAKNFIT
jgi:hypothetical protein